MKKLLLILALSLAAPSFAQTNAEIVSKTLAVRNAKVCDSFDLDAACSDAQVQATWCVRNNKPAGAMCAASDVRTDEQKVVTAAQMYAERQKEQAEFAAGKVRKARKALLADIELAIIDPDLRVAVCAAIKKPDPEVCR
jgi:hypothetical protein